MHWIWNYGFWRGDTRNRWLEMGKVKFGEQLKAGSKQACVNVPSVITYHPSLKR